MFVHALDRFAETFIGEPQQDTTVDQARIQSGPNEKHEDVFEETIERSLPAWELGGSFGEQELEGWSKLGKGIQGNDEWLWERGDKWIQHSDAEFYRRADEFCAFFYRAVNAVLVGTRKEQDAWSIEDQLPSVGMSDGQGSFSEHMKIACLLVEAGGDSTEPS